MRANTDDRSSTPLLIVHGYSAAQNQLENRDLMRELQEWESHIEVFERQFQIPAFFDLAPDLEDEAYGRLFAKVWTECDNIYEHQAHLLASPHGSPTVDGQRDDRG